jgi:hypothetical protein
VIERTRNQGSGRAANPGARHARDEDLCSLSPGCGPPPDLLTAGVDAVAGTARRGVVPRLARRDWLA